MNFTQIEDVYNYLEDTDPLFDKEYELSAAINMFHNTITDTSIKNKLKWEVYALDYVIKDGKTGSLHSTTKEDGTSIYEYPSYKDFGEDGLNYLKKRSQSTQNDYLLCRYNHILWNSPKPHKHLKYAQRAVEAYFRISSSCLEIMKEGKQFEYLEKLKNGLKLSFESKYMVDEYRSMIHSILFDKNKFPSDSKTWLIQTSLELNVFNKDELQKIHDLIKRIWSNHIKKKTDYYATVNTLEIGLNIAQKIGKDTKIWNKRIGDSIVRMANYRMDDESRMIPLHFLKEAIPYYKLAGLPKKVTEVEKQFFDLKKELKLSEVNIPLDSKVANALDNHIEETTENMLKEDSDRIYGFLLSGKHIFPNIQWLTKITNNKNNAFLDLINTIEFDINKNIGKSKNDKKSIENSKIFEAYSQYIYLSALPLLNRLFVEGIKRNKLTFDNLIEFFINHTWLGQTYAETDSANKLREYNWLSLLAPSLLEFFRQTESALKSIQPAANYVMPIDSLTIKFEGVLRDFCRLLKISTTVTGKGNILREKYIEELLSEKEVQKYFDENDLLFFKYLFVAKEGLNLRNNIAHCFYRYNRYNYQLIYLLICAYLRIGKYKFKAKTNTDAVSSH